MLAGAVMDEKACRAIAALGKRCLMTYSGPSFNLLIWTNIPRRHLSQPASRLFKQTDIYSVLSRQQCVTLLHVRCFMLRPAGEEKATLKVQCIMQDDVLLLALLQP